MKTPTQNQTAASSADDQAHNLRSSSELMAAALARFNSARVASRAASQEAIQVRALCW